MYVELAVAQRPAVLVAGKNAGCIWEALHGWKGAFPSEKIASMMRALAYDSIALRELAIDGPNCKSLLFEARR